LFAGSLGLASEESHHGIKVLRLRLGDPLVLFDGVGGEAAAVVLRIERRGLFVTAGTPTTRPFDLSRRLTLAVALPKVPHQSALFEKCTELGVAAIRPIHAERSVFRPGDEASRKWARWMIEAARQSRRAWVPEILEPMTFQESLCKAGEFDAAAIAHPHGFSEPFREWIAACVPGSSIIVWIGPEGGWTADELDAAARAGIRRTRLSPTILRTETAAMAVCVLTAALDREPLLPNDSAEE